MAHHSGLQEIIQHLMVMSCEVKFEMNHNLIKAIIVNSVIFCYWVSMATAANTQLIYAGKLLSVAGEPPLSQQTIVVKNDLITAIVPGFIDINEFDNNAQLIDLSKYSRLAEATP